MEKRNYRNLPKIEFDYDLWTTEEGKYMVRIRSTGEVAEVDRAVMRVLRADEKRNRRASAQGKRLSVLSLDILPEDIADSRWLADKHDFMDDVLMNESICEFQKMLTENQRSAFYAVILQGKGVREYAQEKGINHKSVVETMALIRKKAKKYFKVPSQKL